MRLKRLVASVSAGFEDFVTKVENHEAVAECLIDEVRQSAARVRVQQARVQAQIGRLQTQRSELDDEQSRWNERAAGLADRDEAKALECLRRARRIEARLAAIEAQLDDHLRLADDLGERLARLEQRLEDLQLRRTALSSRAATAQTARHAGAACTESVDRVFDRWETAVLADEYRDELADQGLPQADTLDREFREQEEMEDLRARLALLKQGAGS